MKKNIYILFIYPIFLIGFFIVSLAVDTANKLNGKFFSENSPIWAGYYPNDFLALGVFIFLLMGLLISNFLFNHLSENFSYILIFVLSFLPLLVIVIFQGHDSYFFENWAYLLSQLIKIWRWALIVGLVLGFFLYQIEKKIEKGNA
jgi:hypothetical protein